MLCSGRWASPTTPLSFGFSASSMRDNVTVTQALQDSDGHAGASDHGNHRKSHGFGFRWRRSGPGLVLVIEPSSHRRGWFWGTEGNKGVFRPMPMQVQEALLSNFWRNAHSLRDVLPCHSTARDIDTYLEQDAEFIMNDVNVGWVFCRREVWGNTRDRISGRVIGWGPGRQL